MGLSVAAAVAVGLLAAYGPFQSRTSAQDALASTTPRRVTLTVAPYFGPEARAELRPIARYLDRVLGVRVNLTMASTTARAIDDVVEGATDLALLPALGCVQAKERAPDVRYLAHHATDGAWTSAATLVVRGEDRVERIAALRGRRVCVADPAATGGHLLLRAALRHRGLAPSRFFDGIRWTGTPSDAVRDLVERRCDVAAVPRYVWRRSPSASELREVATLGVTPLACWAGGSSLDDRLAAALTDALSALEPHFEFGQDRIGRTLAITDLRPADDSTYLSVLVSARLEGLLRPTHRRERPVRRADP